MPLRPFVYHRPKSLSELLGLLAMVEDDFVLMGGGTEVLLQIKEGLKKPQTVIGLGGIGELSLIKEEEDGLFIGAGVKLSDVANAPTVNKHFPALAQAARKVASPQLRNMGTIGGNVCLDTRCHYFNQVLWAGGFDPCLKRKGERCYVVPAGKRCYALFCADTPAALLLFDTEVRLISPRGERKVPLNDLYRDDGMDHLSLRKDEVIVGFKLFYERGRRSGYVRFSPRKAIDFPLVGIALAVTGERGKGEFSVRIAATGLTSRPLRLSILEELIKEDCGRDWEEGMERLAVVRHGGISPSYRRHIALVLTERLLNGL